MSETVKKVVLGSVGAAGLFLASGAVANAANVHTVVSNDTIWSLAHQYGVSQDSLEKQNNIDPQTHTIYQGQKLTISAGETSHQATTTGNYTVQAGDSLWTIAQNAGISVAQLREANGLGLNSSVIQPGQTLRVDGQQNNSTKQTAQVTVNVNEQPVSQTKDLQEKQTTQTRHVAAPPQSSTVSDSSSTQVAAKADEDETSSARENSSARSTVSSQGVMSQEKTVNKIQQPAEKVVGNNNSAAQSQVSSQNVARLKKGRPLVDHNRHRREQSSHSQQAKLPQKSGSHKKNLAVLIRLEIISTTVVIN